MSRTLAEGLAGLRLAPPPAPAPAPAPEVGLEEADRRARLGLDRGRSALDVLKDIPLCGGMPSASEEIEDRRHYVRQVAAAGLPRLSKAVWGWSESALAVEPDLWGQDTAAVANAVARASTLRQELASMSESALPERIPALGLLRGAMVRAAAFLNQGDGRSESDWSRGTSGPTYCARDWLLCVAAHLDGEPGIPWVPPPLPVEPPTGECPRGFNPAVAWRWCEVPLGAPMPKWPNDARPPQGDPATDPEWREQIRYFLRHCAPGDVRIIRPACQDCPAARCPCGWVLKKEQP
jgi:hypothetical protein